MDQQTERRRFEAWRDQPRKGGYSDFDVWMAAKSDAGVAVSLPDAEAVYAEVRRQRAGYNERTSLENVQDTLAATSALMLANASAQDTSRQCDESCADPAVAAIKYALKDFEGLAFLRCWLEGDFKAIREEWPDCPEEVFIGADLQHPETVI